jgi:hypothetical protein
MPWSTVLSARDGQDVAMIVDGTHRSHTSPKAVEALQDGARFPQSSQGRGDGD